jgi:SAM-dependent methyltransferase
VFDAASYWDHRYRKGRTSGAGSEGSAAAAKAAYVNALIARESIRSVVDWGCGDGTVLDLLHPGIEYVGLDVSPHVIQRHRRERLSRGHFLLLRRGAHPIVLGELGLSLDVVFHLVDDRDYEEHLANLFGAASRFVLVHSADYDGGHTTRHVRWRHWTGDVRLRFPQWHLREHPEDPQIIGFYLYERNEGKR